MISPASGIHRPSYNGAPAMQTLFALQNSKLLIATFCLCQPEIFFCASTFAGALPSPLEPR